MGLSTRTTFIALASLGALGLLLGAFAFQFLAGLAPCAMCIWQRWPHVAALALGTPAALAGGPALPLAGAAAELVGAGIAAYHTGVERGWWLGPSSCTGGAANLGGLSGADLLSTEAPVTIVMCDEVAWSLAGLSMASWNGILSLVLAGFWLVAAWRSNGAGTLR